MYHSKYAYNDYDNEGKAMPVNPSLCNVVNNYV